MKRWWLLAWLGGSLSLASYAQDVRVKFITQPPQARIVLKSLKGLKDRELPHAGDIYTLPAALLPGDLVFSMDGYADGNKTLNLTELNVLPEDPLNPGVRLYPVVSLTAQSEFGLAFFVRDHPFLLGILGISGIMLGSVALRKYAAARPARHRLAKIERLSRAGGDDPMVGRHLDHYLLTDRLGSGGMATVYRGIPFDSLDESQAVALKLIREENQDEEFFQRFKREVDVTKSLNHPNTLRLFGWGEQDRLFFLIMELVDGKPLKPPPGGFSLAQFKALLPGLMAGLLYAHERGIVHRDLKPDNLMLMSNGQVKVMDFGLARSHEMKTVTATGTALGTPAYMAPEQILGGSPNPSSDQYSLGVTFYELLCGRRPFEQTELVAVIQAHLHEQPMPLRMFRPDFSLELEQIVMRMLCKEPERRFPDLQAVQRALLEALT